MSEHDIIKEIIKEQSLLIGEQLARQMAESSGVVKFNSSKISDISIVSDSMQNAIEKVIDSYSSLFGQASVEVCVEVIKRFPQQSTLSLIPESLKTRFN